MKMVSLFCLKEPLKQRYFMMDGRMDDRTAGRIDGYVDVWLEDRLMDGWTVSFPARGYVYRVSTSRCST